MGDDLGAIVEAQRFRCAQGNVPKVTSGRHLEAQLFGELLLDCSGGLLAGRSLSFGTCTEATNRAQNDAYGPRYK